MLYTLENDKLCVLVRSHGAELRSIKERADETEYLWDGNPSWWKYSSPVLFPIVGKLLNGKYRVDGQEMSCRVMVSAVSQTLSWLSVRRTVSGSALNGLRNRSRNILGNSSWISNMSCTTIRLRSSGPYRISMTRK